MGIIITPAITFRQELNKIVHIEHFLCSAQYTITIPILIVIIMVGFFPSQLIYVEMSERLSP